MTSSQAVSLDSHRLLNTNAAWPLVVCGSMRALLGRSRVVSLLTTYGLPFEGHEHDG
jgi:hypothetical protein